MANPAVRLFLAVFLGAFPPIWTASAEPIKLGVPLALTGDLAQLGTDMKNALLIVNEKIGNDRYKLIIEDDRCSNKDAIAIARRFIDIEKLKYAFGFACNHTLIASAPIYERAGLLVISGSGTSGDIPSLGKHNFRFFPSDVYGAERLFGYLKSRHKSISILTEQSEYSVMMERTFQKFNTEAGNPIQIQNFSFTHNDTDLRALLTKIKGLQAEAIYINADSDTSFITVLKELAVLKYKQPRYTVYLGASASVLSAVPELDEGIVFSNLPSIDGLLSDKGREIMVEFKKRFGEPQSGFPVVPTTIEAFRMMDNAIQSGQDPAEYLRNRTVTDGYMPPYKLDENGNIVGLKFEMQVVRDRKAVLLEK